MDERCCCDVFGCQGWRSTDPRSDVEQSTSHDKGSRLDPKNLSRMQITACGEATDDVVVCVSLHSKFMTIMFGRSRGIAFELPV